MPENKKLDSSTFEIVIFSVRKGVTKSQLIESAEPVNNWVRKQPGFLDRKLISGDTDKFVEIVRWNSLKQAHAASELAESSPECAPMFALIDMESTTFLHGSSILQATV